MERLNGRNGKNDTKKEKSHEKMEWNPKDETRLKRRTNGKHKRKQWKETYQ